MLFLAGLGKYIIIYQEYFYVKKKKNLNFKLNYKIGHIKPSW